MKKYLISLSALGVLGAVEAAAAEPLKVGVSWANYQEERYSIEESAMRDQLSKNGAELIATDAQSSASRQLTDIENLITQEVDVIIINAQDAQAILPAVESAEGAGIPVIAYGRVIESPHVLYIGFDNKEVGRMQAREILKHAPKGNYAFIKGAASDPNADILYSGAIEVLQSAIDKGDIKNVGDVYTDGWLPTNAQRNLEQILTTTNSVSAVIAANDGTAGGAIAALSSQGMAGTVAVAGQDGDKAAINRIALGTQTISVWQDVRILGKAAADFALDLGKDPDKTKIPDLDVFKGGPTGISVSAKLLNPTPITINNISLLIDSKWISKAEVCVGVPKGKVAVCG